MLIKISPFLLLTLTLTCIHSFPSDDLIELMPDYPYKGRMHSGYLQLSDARKKLHYLLVENESSPSTAPLLLWLNGGPGCSSLGGFSTEHGPASFIPGTARWTLNDESWHKQANVLYLESPAGVGFSHVDSNNPDDLASDDFQSGKENLEALIEFFKRFPDLQQNEFYISGESYAGIYLPYLATYILQNNQSADREVDIKLKGMLVGNGVTDWKYDTAPATIDFAYTHALYGTDTRDKFNESCVKNFDKQKCDEVNEEINELLSQVNVYSIYDKCFTPSSNGEYTIGDIEKKYRYTPWFMKNKEAERKRMEKLFLSGEKNLNDLKHPKLKDGPPCVDDVGFNVYYNRQDVKLALNVKLDIKFELCSEKVSPRYTIGKDGSYYLYPDLIRSGIRIFKMSGDTDAVVPFNGTEKWIKNLNLPVLEKWRSWNIGDKMNIGGFVTKYEGLTFVTVRGAGHMVPECRPQEASHIIDCFLTGKDL